MDMRCPELAYITMATDSITCDFHKQVLEIQVADGAFNPNPALLSVNDVVAWTFHGLRHNDVCTVDDITQVLDAQNNSKTVSPR